MESKESIINSVLKTGSRYYIVVALSVSLIALMSYAWTVQLLSGLAVTSLGRPIYWGGYIVNFVFLAATAAAGIAISAGVRLMHLKDYATVGRLGEMLTIAALSAASLNVIFDLGRPDRAVLPPSLNLFMYGRYSSPFVWDLTVLTMYATATIVYFIISVRPDIHELSQRSKGIRNVVYKIVLFGYKDTTEIKSVHASVSRLTIILLVPILVTFHSVLGFVFGLQSSIPGWYSPLTAPHFIIAAVGTGLAVIIVIAGLMRKFFGLRGSLPNKVFSGLGTALMLFILAELYFVIAEIITVFYSGPEHERHVYTRIVLGDFAPVYWGTLLFGLALPLFMLSKSVFTRTMRRPRVVYFAAVLTLVALWLKRFALVAPPLSVSHLPLAIAPPYYPSWVEWSLIFGSYGVGGLVFLLLLKLVPVRELGEEIEIPRAQKVSRIPAIGVVVLGLSLIISGLYAMGVSAPAPGVRGTTEIPGGPMMLLGGIVATILSPLVYVVSAGRRAQPVELQKARIQ